MQYNVRSQHSQQVFAIFVFIYRCRTLRIYSRGDILIKMAIALRYFLKKTLYFTTFFLHLYTDKYKSSY